jgi:predicted metal-dependent peptidase
MTTSAAAAEKLTIARAQLLLNKGHGFFGMLALRLKLVEDPTVKTLCVDGKRISYNPDFVLNQLSDSLTRSALAHEVMHCVFQHIGRRGDRDPRKWNKAGDYAINLVLEDAGFEVGKSWLLNHAYVNMTADEIYNLLPDEDGGHEGDDPLDEIGDGGEDHEVTDVEWKIAAVQAATASKANGTLPGALKRFVEEITAPPKVDWRQQLRQFVTEVSKDDYAWTRPNRRYLAAGLYLPGLWSESMGEVAIGIDTSGSIDQDTLNAFGAEIKAIASAVRPSKIHVIYCDMEVNHVDVFDATQELHFDMHGGGGTDFRPPFEYLQEQGITPRCFIYLTDLYGPGPESVDFPVLWVSTTDEVAPTGQTIHIEV